MSLTGVTRSCPFFIYFSSWTYRARFLSPQVHCCGTVIQAGDFRVVSQSKPVLFATSISPGFIITTERPEHRERTVVCPGSGAEKAFSLQPVEMLWKDHQGWDALAGQW